MNPIHFLRTFERLRYGSLWLTTPEGKAYFFQGTEAGPAAELTLLSWKPVQNALLRGDIALGEDYIAGLWDTRNIETLFSLFILNMDALEAFAHGDWLRRACFNFYNRIMRRNSKSGSKSNIAAHYDVGNEFYRLWLDDSMTYSSALYKNGVDNLADAQGAKYKRILDRIDGNSVLEIGCGWGGFAQMAANDQRRVTGLTISPAQHAFATKRLGGAADIKLQDYRDSSGTFDSIVSIEMFEAVGENYWPIYFKTVSERLKRGGTALIQTITIRDDLFEGYRQRSDFIRHYVFPGGMLPSTQKFCQQAAQAGLEPTDVFAFGQDYARTLREWSVKFDEKYDAIKSLGYSDAFIRNWRFYMGTCAAAFAVGRTNVVQVELKHA